MEFKILIEFNPLVFFSLEERSTDWLRIVRDLHGNPPATVTIDVLEARYRELAEDVQLFGFPAVPAFIEKVLTPLRNAKAAYILGNFLGTIALCGMVAEMSAILLYDVRQFTINGEPLDAAKQRGVFGRRVEQLGQERKIDLLAALSMISVQEREALTRIKDIRKKYLHLYSHAHENIQDDARTAFKHTANIVASLMGIRPGSGAMSLDDRFVRYLRRIGFISPDSATDEESSNPPDTPEPAPRA